MDYTQYLKSLEWKQKKVNRLAFDSWQCAFCHCRVEGIYETHHVNYIRLGHEEMKDVITLCPACHKTFHEIWSKKDYWTNAEENHWNAFDLSETAKFCVEYYYQDYFFGGDLNLCSLDTISQCIDQYYTDHNITTPIYINADDIRLFFRNARYEVIIISSDRKENLDDLLDRKFGKKGISGGNKKRANAKAFATKHKISAMKRILNENKDITELTNKVRNILYKEKF